MDQQVIATCATCFVEVMLAVRRSKLMPHSPKTLLASPWDSWDILVQKLTLGSALSQQESQCKLMLRPLAKKI